MTSQLVFTSGLPRSGSTLLMNLLGQNPAHYVTPTSGLIELFVGVKNRWLDVTEFRSAGLDFIKPRVLGSMRGLLSGFFEEELACGKTVFDKSRGWLNYIEILEEALGRQVKVIVTVRDVRAIAASFEKIYRKRSIEHRETSGPSYFNCQTVEGRAKELLSAEAVVGLAINRLRDALQRGLGDRLVIVPYNALTTHPEETMTLLHAALGLPPYEYDPNNVRQVTHENDLVHGMDLHRVRRKIEPPSSASWEGVLPPRLADAIAREYADVQQLCGSAGWQEFQPTIKSVIHLELRDQQRSQINNGELCEATDIH